jgi:uncharacterized protein (TIGR00730 family)
VASQRRVCVFAGARIGEDRRFVEAAQRLGTETSERGYGLVFGGESVGLMGAVARAALRSGGEVIGVIPGFLADTGSLQKEADIRLVGTLGERKQLMADLSDGFVALPGGLGTLDELTEMVTWTQLGIHRNKPLALLEVAKCWAELASLLDEMVANGFLGPENRALLHFANSAAGALDAAGFPAPPTKPPSVHR